MKGGGYEPHPRFFAPCGLLQNDSGVDRTFVPSIISRNKCLNNVKEASYERTGQADRQRTQRPYRALADKVAKEKKISRSKVVAHCLEELAKKKTEDEMAEGYKALADEHLAFAKMAGARRPRGCAGMEIKRGEIYWVDWSPGRGSEQLGLRPALVIQNDTGNKFGPTTIVAALTTATEKPYPFLVKCAAAESGLSKDGTVNLAAIITLDKAQLVKKAGELSADKMAEVDAAIRASLGVG